MGSVVVEPTGGSGPWSSLLSRLRGPRKPRTTAAHPACPQDPTLSNSPPPTAPDIFANKKEFPFLRNTIFQYPDASSLISKAHLERWPIVRDTLQQNVERSAEFKRYIPHIHYDLRICGPSPHESAPSIVVYCPQKIMRGLNKIFKQPHVKEQYHIDSVYAAGDNLPRFNIFLWGRTIQMLSGKVLSVNLHRPQGQNASLTNRSTLCGAPVSLSGAPDRRSTIACVWRIGSAYYALTSAHALDYAAPENFIDDFSFDEDPSDDEFDFSELKPPLNKENDPGSQCRPDLPPLTAMEMSNSPAFEAIISSERNTTSDPYLDWALVKLDDPSHWLPNIYIPPAGSEKVLGFPKYSPTTRSGSLSAHVHVISSRSTFKGTMSMIPSFAGGCGKDARELWTVDLYNKTNNQPKRTSTGANENAGILPGDSGSLVVDAQTGQIYGHIIAVNPAGQLYVVPIYMTLKKIMETMKTTSIELPDINHGFSSLISRKSEILNHQLMSELDNRIIHWSRSSRVSNRLGTRNELRHIDHSITSCPNATPLARGSSGTVWKVRCNLNDLSMPSSQYSIRTVNTTSAVESGYSLSPGSAQESYALKVFHGSHCKKQARSEFGFLKALDHDHLMKTFGTYNLGDEYGIFLPLAQYDLDQYMLLNPSTNAAFLQDAVKQLSGLADGLNYLHTGPGKQGSGRLHLDIKPSNILVFRNAEYRNVDSNLSTETGTWVLADFGLSRMHNRPFRSTSSKTCNHYTSYTSFHLKSSSFKHLRTDERYTAAELELHRLESCAADVWSFGCVALEAAVWMAHGATGRHSFLKKLASDDENGVAKFWTRTPQNQDTTLAPAVEHAIHQLADSHVLSTNTAIQTMLQLFGAGGVLELDPATRMTAAKASALLGKQSQVLTEPSKRGASAYTVKVHQDHQKQSVSLSTNKLGNIQFELRTQLNLMKDVSESLKLQVSAAQSLLRDVTEKGGFEGPTLQYNDTLDVDLAKLDLDTSRKVIEQVQPEQKGPNSQNKLTELHDKKVSKDGQTISVSTNIVEEEKMTNHPDTSPPHEAKQPPIKPQERPIELSPKAKALLIPIFKKWCESYKARQDLVSSVSDSGKGLKNIALSKVDISASESETSRVTRARSLYSSNTRARKRSRSVSLTRSLEEETGKDRKRSGYHRHRASPDHVGAPRKLRSGGVTHFRSGDFETGQYVH